MNVEELNSEAVHYINKCVLADIRDKSTAGYYAISQEWADLSSLPYFTSSNKKVEYVNVIGKLLYPQVEYGIWTKESFETRMENALRTVLSDLLNTGMIRGNMNPLFNRINGVPFRARLFD